MDEDITIEPLKRNKLKTFGLCLLTAVVFFGIGYYVGGVYGFNIFAPEETGQELFAQRETELINQLDRGLITTVSGKIKSIDKENRTFVFLDGTLATVMRVGQPTIEREVVISPETIIGRREVSDGPRFPVTIDFLKPGQSAVLWLSKNDFGSMSATARAVIVEEYIRLDSSILGSGQ